MDSVLGLDAILLARIQFAFTIAFHFLFPAVSIGLASYLAVLNGMYLWRRDEAFLRLFNYWVKIFAITFAMGVVSGIVMSYQFGTNWSVFSDRAGPIIGPLMAYEVLTAFFLEAGFLGIMLFGREQVGPALHMAACLLVAIGTGISATWILSANSWMQTPQGCAIGENGQFLPADWWAVIFNPSFPYRLAHTLTAAYLATAFIVGGVGAWHLLRGRAPTTASAPCSRWRCGWRRSSRRCRSSSATPTGSTPSSTSRPRSWRWRATSRATRTARRCILFGLPDQEAQTVRFALEIPKLSSLILKHALTPRSPGSTPCRATTSRRWRSSSGRSG